MSRNWLLGTYFMVLELTHADFQKLEAANAAIDSGMH